MTINRRDTATTSFLIEQCRRELTHQLQKVLKSKYELHIPKKQDNTFTSKYEFFHLFPEVFFQISGTTEMRLPDQTLRLKPGSITVIPAGMPHAETAEPGRNPFLNIVVAFRKKALTFHLAKEKNNKPYIFALQIFESPLTDTAKEFLKRLIESGRLKEKEAKLLTKGLLSGYLAALLSILNEKAERAPTEEWGKEYDKIARCKTLISDNLGNSELTVKTLAEWLTCTPEYLSQLFHRKTKIKLCSYINRARISNAQFMLDTTTTKIAAVGWAAGYRDPGYFNRVFKKLTGKTPLEYRKETIQKK